MFDALEVAQAGSQYFAEHSPGAIEIPAVQQRPCEIRIRFGGLAHEQLAAGEFHVGRIAQHQREPGERQPKREGGLRR